MPVTQDQTLVIEIYRESNDHFSSNAYLLCHHFPRKKKKFHLFCWFVNLSDQEHISVGGIDNEFCQSIVQTRFDGGFR